MNNTQENHTMIPKGATYVIVPVPESLYGPLWRQADKRDTTVASPIVEALFRDSGSRDEPDPENVASG